MAAKLLYLIMTGATIIGTTVARQWKQPGKHISYAVDTTQMPKAFGFGRAASPQDIARWDISIPPDGKGLPPGEGTVNAGITVYKIKCAACHGETGEAKAGVKLPAPALVSDTAANLTPKTIGNYWPYATTLFDYIRRAMPYNQPGSLSDNEVYNVTAFLLNANKIISANITLNASNLPKVVMPACKLYIKDVRKPGPEIR